MSYLDLAQRIRLRFDRRKVGAPTLNSQPGAHTGSTRQYIPGYSDSNIVFLNTSTGNDGNTGASIAQAKLTYASAATAAGSTKKIRVVNDGASFTANITKPTEMTIGVSGTIASDYATAVETWTAAGTPSFSTTTINNVMWSDLLGKFVAVALSGKIGYSSDGNTWTQAATPSFSTSAVYGIAESPTVLVACGGGGKVATSTDGITWTQQTSGGTNTMMDIVWCQGLGVFVMSGADNFLATSPDGITWTLVVNKSPLMSSVSTNSIYCLATNDTGTRVYAGALQYAYIYYSDDGTTWKDATQPAYTSSDSITSITQNSNSGTLYAFTSTRTLTSTDGITWAQTASTTGALRAKYYDDVSMFVTNHQTGYVLASSTDAVSFNTVNTPNMTTQCSGTAYSESLGIMVGVGSSGQISYVALATTTISASVAGFTINAALYSGTLTAYNCTMYRPRTSAALSFNACRVTASGCRINNNSQRHYGTLFEGDMSMVCIPSNASAVAFDYNTVGGAFRIYNSSQTGYEQIRDNIIENGLYASYAVIVTSGNIRGTRTNATCTRAVSFSDPVFVDTTDYKLQRVTNGDSQDSPLVYASAYYVNEQGQPRDFGAWSYDDSTLPYEYKRAFYLLKPKETGIRPEKQPAASADQGMDGTWDAVNEPSRAAEYLTLQYGSGVPVDHITAQDLLESLTDLTCEISLDPDLSDPDTDITVNGAHSVGDCVLTIDASTTIKAGMVLTIGSYKYYILYCYPSTSPTKLILHQALLSSVADNLVITPQEPASYGTYQYIPQSRQIPRPQSQETEYVNGAVFKFVRQYPQL